MVKKDTHQKNQVGQRAIFFIGAESKGGQFLSTRYNGTKVQHDWECAKKHRWQAIPSSIIRGSWCPTCGKNARAIKQKYTIEDMQKFAESKGGKYISETYTSAHKKEEWECAKKHRWQAIPSSVFHGSWCPTCGYKAGAIKRRKN